MSIRSEANRIVELRNRLRTRLAELGYEVSPTSSLEDCVMTLESFIPNKLTYTVETASGASYGFKTNASGYYESENKGIGSSASVCILTLTAVGSFDVTLDCISYGESNYDFGIISVKNGTLSTSYSEDTTNVLKSFKGLSSPSVQKVSLGTIKDETAKFYIKYRKDSSGNNGNDSLQFKVVY